MGNEQQLETVIARFVERWKLVRRGEQIDVALSGGPDSVALLALLSALRGRYEWRLRAHHVRHGLRDDTHDEAIAREAASSLGVKLIVTRLEEGAVASSPGQGLEDQSRRQRYRALLTAAKANGTTAIATGHHGDDNIETFLLRAARGAGLEGLSGIRPLSMRDGIRVLRPLLEIGRARVVDYLQSSGFVYCHDPSNDSPRHLRNRVRAELVPAFRRLHGEGGLNAFRRSLLVLSDDADALAHFAEAEVRRGILTSEPAWYLPRSAPGVSGSGAAQVLRHAARSVAPGHIPRADVISQALALIADESRSGAGLVEDGAVQIGRDGRFVVVRATIHNPPELPEAIDLEPGEVSWRGARIQVRKDIGSESKVGTSLGLPLEELRLVPATLLERIAPIGMTGHKRIRRVLAEMGVPQPWRAGHPVVEHAGRAIWVVGGPLACEARPPGTRTTCVIELSHSPWYGAGSGCRHCFPSDATEPQKR